MRTADSHLFLVIFETRVSLLYSMDMIEQILSLKLIKGQQLVYTLSFLQYFVITIYIFFFNTHISPNYYFIKNQTNKKSRYTIIDIIAIATDNKKRSFF